MTTCLCWRPKFFIRSPKDSRSHPDLWSGEEQSGPPAADEGQRAFAPPPNQRSRDDERSPSPGGGFCRKNFVQKKRQPIPIGYEQWSLYLRSTINQQLLYLQALFAIRDLLLSATWTKFSDLGTGRMSERIFFTILFKFWISHQNLPKASTTPIRIFTAQYPTWCKGNE